MKLTVGDQLLGDYAEEIYIGGFSASSSGETQTGRGPCDGLGRLRDRGNVIASMTIPTMREFATVSEAEKWIADTAKVGGYEGGLMMEFDDGSDTRFPWSVARPGSMTHKGVTVITSWNIEAGDRLV